MSVGQTEYLDLFLRNLLLDEKNELHNRSMHISGLLNGTKADIEEQKSDIEEVKADIKEQKSDIEELLHTKLPNVSEKTKGYVLMLYREFNYDIYFGRSDVERLTGLKSSRASELLKEIVESGLIEPIKGHGKGKYQFVVEKNQK